MKSTKTTSGVVSSSHKVTRPVVSGGSGGGKFVGLVLSLEADEGVEDSNGDPADDSDKVLVWRDQSGQGNDAHQEVLESQPTLTASVLNGLPGVFFDGSQYMRLLTGLDMASGIEGLSVFALFSNTSALQQTDRAIITFNISGVGPRAQVCYRTWNGRDRSAGRTLDTDTLARFDFSNRGTSGTCFWRSHFDYLNGQIRSSTTITEAPTHYIELSLASSGKTSDTPLGSITIGSAGTSTYAMGYLMGLRVYNRLATSQEEDDIKDFWVNKYGDV